MAYEVTIGIPVYNVEKYIRQTLECILGQTFKSIEYVFCETAVQISPLQLLRR